MTTQNQTYQLFNSSGCITFTAINLYFEKQLSDEELRMVEEHLIDCPMCSDAMDGFSESGDLQQSDQNIHAMINEIKARTQEENPDKNTRLKAIHRRRYILSAAASIVLLLGIYFTYYYWNHSERVFSEHFETYPATDQSEESISPVNETGHTDIVVHDSVNYPLADNIKQPKNQEQDKKNETKPDKTKSTNIKKTVDDVLAIADDNEDADNKVTANEIDEVEAEELPSENQDRQESDIMDENHKLNERESQPVDIQDLDIIEDEEISIADNNNQSFYEKNKSGRYNGKKRITKAERKGKRTRAATIQKNEPVDTFHSEKHDSILQHALNLYKEENYKKAINNFEIVLRDVPQNSKALMYCAVSQLAINKPDAAIANLESILQSGHNLYIPAAQWYIALAYLKKNNKAKAKAMLQEIIKQDSEYKRQAEKTLQDLK